MSMKGTPVKFTKDNQCKKNKNFGREKQPKISTNKINNRTIHSVHSSSLDNPYSDLTAKKIEEVFTELFYNTKNRQTREQRYNFGEEVYPGLYYLGPGVYGGIGALNKAKDAIANATVEEIMK